jgi:hypothetical protein
MAMTLKRKMFTVCEEIRIIEDMEKNPAILQADAVNCLWLPPLSLSNILSCVGVLCDK